LTSTSPAAGFGVGRVAGFSTSGAPGVEISTQVMVAGTEVIGIPAVFW
jgi:hypothetical protein